MALAFLAFLPIGIIVMRIESHAFTEEKEEGLLEEMTLDSFSSIRLADHFSVYIEQGPEHKLEYELITNPVASPIIIQAKKELYLKWDTSQYHQIDSSLQIKIEVPRLNYIRAGANTIVELQKFGKDSMTIELAEGAEYVGGSNHFDYLSIVKKNR